MTLTEQDRTALTKNYISKSYQTIEQVNFLIEHNQFTLAANRIYYGIYYALSALALKHKFSTSKHLRLIGWFNKTYIKGNIIDKRYGKIIRKAYDNRMEGDYNVLADFSKEEIMQSFKEMKEVIIEINKLL